MKFRPCKKADLIQCEKLFDLPELVAANGTGVTVPYLVKFLSEKYFLVAEEKGKIVGAIYGEKLKAGGTMMWALAVDGDFRGEGVGTKLMKMFEKNTREDKRKWIVLHASTKTERTVNFYRKFGYDVGNRYVECAKDLI